MYKPGEVERFTEDPGQLTAEELEYLIANAPIFRADVLFSAWSRINGDLLKQLKPEEIAMLFDKRFAHIANGDLEGFNNAIQELSMEANKNPKLADFDPYPDALDTFCMKMNSPVPQLKKIIQNKMAKIK